MRFLQERKIGFGGFENNGMGREGGKEERGWSGRDGKSEEEIAVIVCVRDEKTSNSIGTRVGEWE